MLGLYTVILFEGQTKVQPIIITTYMCLKKKASDKQCGKGGDIFHSACSEPCVCTAIRDYWQEICSVQVKEPYLDRSRALWKHGFIVLGLEMTETRTSCVY